ncbi:MAG: 1,4-dihydroxy-2-naphthoate polyprenyltransferase [Sciscionella sp.]|nr:1,4-dihydroxy-2-naphthoate polyprenyltransferase [Sciscionella sp.]
MATPGQWLEGARPRTLPNAIAPVLVGTGAAIGLREFVWWQAILTLVVSLSLIIGVNFANDYSDGIKGTDDDRVGPLRLVGAKLAKPATVRAAAFTAFGVAALAGLGLVIATGHWWLLAIGALCILGAWFYTGGSRPYGYAGFGELAVFLFFGLVAVLGTMYVQAGFVTATVIFAAIAIGSFSSAVMLTNNLRDVDTDAQTGKRTMAVRLGEDASRQLYCALTTVPLLVSVLTAGSDPLVLLGLLAIAPLFGCWRKIITKVRGPALIPVLRDTGIAMLIWGLMTGIGLAFG